MPRYTRCPFYIDESRHSISCEDVCRSYDSLNEKLSWMDIYCDSWDWMKCPYAADISEAYRRYEEGDEMALIEHELKAQKKEIESLLRKLGRANKNIDKLKAKNQDLEAQKRIYFEKWKKAQEQLDEYEKKIADQLGAMAGIYEQRMAFLIDSYAEDGRLYEQEVEEWAKRKDQAFALVHDYDGSSRYWKVVFQEEETEDGQQDQDIQTDVQEGP